MHERDTAAVVAVVGLAGFGGYLIYTGLGMPQIELGNLADWLSASGAFIAAFAALYIATRDRTERERERLAADMAHAKLVLISPTYSSDMGNGPLSYEMVVSNHSERPILDVALVRMELRAADGLVVALPKWDHRHRILKAGGTTRTAGATFVDAAGESFPKAMERVNAYGDKWPTLESLDAHGWIEFSDINGNRWAKSSTDELRRIPASYARQGDK